MEKKKKLGQNNVIKAMGGKGLYKRVRLAYANLMGAHITWAKLELAFLKEINFSGAYLKGCRFWGADLTGADFGGATVKDIDFQYSNLTDADFRGADINESNFTAANLEGTNLKGLKNWHSALSYKDTNLMDVKNPPDGFIEFALARGAVQLPTADWKNNAKAQYPTKTFYFDIEIQP